MGRSSIGLLGVLVHFTAGWIDPGFDGQITLEMMNLRGGEVFLPARSRVCQLVLHKLQSLCVRPYGHPTRGSKYVGDAATGAVASLIGKDAK
jgi:dCTP deaminase